MVNLSSSQEQSSPPVTLVNAPFPSQPNTIDNNNDFVSQEKKQFDSEDDLTIPPPVPEKDFSSVNNSSMYHRNHHHSHDQQQAQYPHQYQTYPMQDLTPVGYVIIILAIVVVTVFKVPTVDYLGPVGDPKFILNEGNVTFGLDMIANIQVQNPNPIGFNFELIAVMAHYPDYEPPIGGGNITSVSFPSHSTKTIQFPVTVRYNRQDDPGYAVVQNILNTCGLLGETGKKLKLLYDVKVTVKILGINISPKIKNQHTEFDCPNNIGDIGKGIADLTSWLGRKLTP
ncbi:hypothetical protein BG004_006230 [Podila humilis]|nr:hypothetical protein BG004_006230 [Podila humilis]